MITSATIKRKKAKVIGGMSSNAGLLMGKAAPQIMLTAAIAPSANSAVVRVVGAMLSPFLYYYCV
jgi:hypothetical protein